MGKDCGKLVFQLLNSFNPRLLFLSVIVFSVYCVFIAIFHFSNTSLCLNGELQNDQIREWESFRPFENGVLLEYKSQSNLCAKTNSKTNCKNGKSFCIVY